MKNVKVIIIIFSTSSNMQCSSESINSEVYTNIEYLDEEFDKASTASSSPLPRVAHVEDSNS